MPRIIPSRNFSLGLDKNKSTLAGVAKFKRIYIRNMAYIGKEVEVGEKQANWFVKAGWAKFVAKDKKVPKKVHVTDDMMKGKEK